MVKMPLLLCSITITPLTLSFYREANGIGGHEAVGDEVLCQVSSLERGDGDRGEESVCAIYQRKNVSL